MGCATYGIRPEHITIDTNGTWQGTIRHVERLGADTILHLEVANLGPLLVRTQGDIAYRVGDTVFATPQSDKEHRFDV
ncbi:TOBE domain-containing protein [Pacificibacter sp.]|uniref:TOBE domain-containing protein n=1 Tax=Pacificibacter sp. TaxID=1917866 RepID=UPI00321ADC52